jgi:hypothetical protein
MLYSFRKYSNVNKNNITINITQRTRRINNITLKRSSVRDNAYTPHFSTFFRRSYFRTLLLYLSVLYSNLTIAANQNVFYVANFITIHYSEYHPSYYFKKLVIR